MMRVAATPFERSRARDDFAELPLDHLAEVRSAIKATFS
jgi:hypothetical protein